MGVQYVGTGIGHIWIFEAALRFQLLSVSSYTGDYVQKYHRALLERISNPITPRAKRQSNEGYLISHNFDNFPCRVTVHCIRPFGFDCGAYTSASLPVFLIPLCQLKSAGVVSDTYSFKRQFIKN